MISSTQTSGSKRRDFLKLAGAGLVSTWAVSAFSMPSLAWLPGLPALEAQASFGAALLRGTQDGRILQSVDEGKTWQQLVSFGAHCAIVGLVTREGQLFAKVSLAGHGFWLSTADARTWHTLA